MLPPAKDGAIANLVPVPVGDAACVALGEAQGLLAFGLERGQDDHMVLVRLDAKGNPSPHAVSWKLPRPDGLAKQRTYPLNCAFHPKLPLLYVWQDVELNYNAPREQLPPAWKQLDHLLLYDVSKETPALLAGLCRGETFMFGQLAAGLAADPGGKHLYVPNLCDAKNAAFTHFGRFALDADGLPDLGDKDAAKLPVPARLKRLAELSATKGSLPGEMTKTEYVYLFPHTAYGAGHSFHVLTPEAILVGNYNGLISWRPGDKQAELHQVPVKSQTHSMIAAHPAQPLAYLTRAGTDAVFRIEHVDGYLSLLPLQITFPKTKLTSPPAVLGKGKALAVGGHYHVYAVGLDDRGRPSGEPVRARVLSQQVRALVYSERFDRLYVGVEVSK